MLFRSTVNGITLAKTEYTLAANGTITFAPSVSSVIVETDIVVDASLETKEITVTVSVGAAGSEVADIELETGAQAAGDPAPARTEYPVEYGGTLTFKVTPKEGKGANGLKLDSTSESDRNITLVGVPGTGAYRLTIKNVTGDVTVTIQETAAPSVTTKYAITKIGRASCRERV